MHAVVQVRGLKPETTYPYNVFVDGKPINVDVQPYRTASRGLPSEGFYFMN